MTHTIVISDLHGRLDLLHKALSKIDEATHLDVVKIIFTGDYVDRGPDSAGVVALVRELEATGEATALKGNHEDMMVDQSEFWIPNGGNTTIESYLTSGDGWVARMISDTDWMRGLPLYYQDEHRIYVHASAQHDQPNPDLFDPQFAMWTRYGNDEDYAWYGKHVVHGHTPKKKPVLKTNRTNLDTGAVFGGPLSVGVFDDSIPGGPVEIWEITGDA